ncbi:long-chain acyl-CoA synthetase [Kutzneria viridogrisea]|uniref:Long-chain acyl-CoA synthetase n=1 Tax=Kutzneria viridogrisea TaxID=47990 RepID=A0ABR6BAG6_9PSEU|nr:long-chain acyl-CoA synthetase [Kutzneria viridogrisea]
MGGRRIDELLANATFRAPDRVVLRAGDREVTYGRLGEDVDHFAAALRRTYGDADLVVAVAMSLEPAFAVGFYGTARAGHVSALVNPLLREEGLLHVLRTCRARVAIVPPALHARLVPVRDRLPDLELILLTHNDPELPEDVPTVATWARDNGSDGVEMPAVAEEQVACLQFTSGTTGAPKAVRLSHRNLLVNAAQTVLHHRLDETSVLCNNLPTFHLMHLNIAVHAGATMLLCAEPNPTAAMVMANRYRATHFYAIPPRLAALARAPELAELEVPSLRAVLSGGATLPVDAATALSAQLGVPVVQGYGLAETSPSVHLADLDRPRPGSSGVPVPGTETRIVDIDTGAVVPLGRSGEIQVRGPQLMLGYLGRDLAADLTPDGWFATGDIGRLDADGHLYVVDRIKDVFKCDNWLVSPTQIERVLMRHAEVAECAVVDHPDEEHTAVACAVIVPTGPSASGVDIAKAANENVPSYEQLRYVALTDHIPRSATGKVDRKQLRALLHHGITPTPVETQN